MILLLRMQEAGGWTRWAVPPLGPQNPDFGSEVSEPAAKPCFMSRPCCCACPHLDCPPPHLIAVPLVQSSSSGGRDELPAVPSPGQRQSDILTRCQAQHPAPCRRSPPCYRWETGTLRDEVTQPESLQTMTSESKPHPGPWDLVSPVLF